MCREEDHAHAKQSAREVADFADLIVTSNGASFDFDLSRLSIGENAWTVRYPAAAIVLAGGLSARMGRDKALLPVEGQPAIAHLCWQLRPHFDEIIVSTNEPAKYSFLEGVTFVEDKQAGKGPLMGLASALKASLYDANFAVACDRPHVDVRALRKLMRAVRGKDAAVPLDAGKRFQPLYGVYRKNAAAKLETSLANGESSVTRALAACDVAVISMDDNHFAGFNTREEYVAYIEQRESVR